MEPVMIKLCLQTGRKNKVQVMLSIRLKRINSSHGIKKQTNVFLRRTDTNRAPSVVSLLRF